MNRGDRDPRRRFLGSGADKTAALSSCFLCVRRETPPKSPLSLFRLHQRQTLNRQQYQQTTIALYRYFAH
ncbi:Uncharacterised protein [Vibrio cholerae]|nr:Uncharacterised protein [Vibrio cholerae]